MTVEIDFQKGNGEIRALNGTNLAPQLYNKTKACDVDGPFKNLKIPITVLHDAPLDNPGMRLVDIQHIFGNFQADAQDPRNYYFRQTDDYIRNCLELGTKVIYRLGTSIEHSVEHYFTYPPEDFEKWTDICINIIRHYNEGWNNGFSWDIKYWQIWNEPDGKPTMWCGEPDEYFRLYTMAANRIKARFPSLKIGGPSTCTLDGWGDRFTEKFLTYCRNHQAPLDFFGWHCYTSQMERIITDPVKARFLLNQYGFENAELIMTEWRYVAPDAQLGSEAFPQMLNGGDSAAFCAGVLCAWQDTPLYMGCFYTASLIWGLFDQYSHPAKTYYAFLAFAKMLEYKQRVKGVSKSDEVKVLAGKDQSNHGALLVSAFMSSADKIEVKISNARPGDKFEVLKLDEKLTLQPVEVHFNSGIVTLEKAHPSTCFLVTGLDV